MPEAPLLQDIEAARTRIRGRVRETPLERSAWLSELAGVPVYLKLECWQVTRSFKLRGALNAVALLDERGRSRGLVTASAGNHGQAVARAAAEAGVHATIFVPTSTPELKQQRIRALGGELIIAGADYDEAERLAVEHARDKGGTFVHAFSDAAVIAGQGTVGLEILEALPDVAEIVVPVGGGGLITGIGTAGRALAPRCRITGVQSERTTAMHAAFAAGHIVDVPVPPTLAEGLAGCTDQASYLRAREVVDDLVLVSEADIARAIRGLHAYDGVIAEGSGAVGVAHVLAGRPVAGSAVVIVSGGNIDAQRLASILMPETES